MGDVPERGWEVVVLAPIDARSCCLLTGKMTACWSDGKSKEGMPLDQWRALEEKIVLSWQL